MKTWYLLIVGEIFGMGRDDGRPVSATLEGVSAAGLRGILAAAGNYYAANVGLPRSVFSVERLFDQDAEYAAPIGSFTAQIISRKRGRCFTPGMEDELYESSSSDLFPGVFVFTDLSWKYQQALDVVVRRVKFSGSDQTSGRLTHCISRVAGQAREIEKWSGTLIDWRRDVDEILNGTDGRLIGGHVIPVPQLLGA